MKSYRLLTDELLVSVGGRMRHGVNNIRGIKTGRVLDANKFNQIATMVSKAVELYGHLPSQEYNIFVRGEVSTSNIM